MAQTAKILIQIPADLLIGATISPQPPRGIVGQPYSYTGTISLTGGLPPYKTPVIVGAATSNGLTVTVSGLTVTISGTPTAPLTGFEIDVDDSTP